MKELVIISLLLTAIIATPCVQDLQCVANTQPVCVASADPRIATLSAIGIARSFSAFPTGECGCYNSNNCQIRQSCLSTAVNDPGTCGCNTAADCNKAYFDSCSSNGICFTSCSTNADCSNTITPLCISKGGVKMCGCTVNSDCTNPNFSMCDIATNVCSSCQQNGDCLESHSDISEFSDNNLDTCFDGKCIDGDTDEHTIKLLSRATLIIVSIMLGLIALSCCCGFSMWCVKKYKNKKTKNKKERKYKKNN